MDKISFPYRASSHLVLLHVINESGAWAKHGLDVNYDFQILKNDAHRAVANGEVEFVGGNHISTYGHRARGDDWVYLGQTVNSYNLTLCVRADSGSSLGRRFASSSGRRIRSSCRQRAWTLSGKRSGIENRSSLTSAHSTPHRARRKRSSRGIGRIS